MKKFSKKLLLSISIVTIVGNTGFGAEEDRDKRTRVAYMVLGRKVNDGIIGCLPEKRVHNGEDNLFASLSVRDGLTDGVYVGGKKTEPARALSSGLGEQDLPVVRLIAGCYGVGTVDLSANSDIRNFPSGSFDRLRDLKHVCLPRGLTEIGDNVFALCDALQYISVPLSLTSVGKGAFWGCKNLRWFVLPEQLANVPPSIFCDCLRLSIAIPRTIATIGSGAFDDCQSLEGLSLPPGVKQIDKEAFRFCHRLETFEITSPLPGGVGSGAFLSTGLRSVHLPFMVGRLGGAAFAHCVNLRIVDVSGVQDFGEDIFINCISLECLTLPASFAADAVKSRKEISETRFLGHKATPRTFYQIPETCEIITAGRRLSFKQWKEEVFVVLRDYNPKVVYQCSWLKGIDDCDRGAITDFAFLDCYFLEDVRLHAIRRIGVCAFQDCRVLKEVNLPWVEVISRSAFYGCDSLHRLHLSWSVRCEGSENRSEGYFHFGNCTSLSEVHLVVTEGYSLTAEEQKARLKAILLDSVGNESVALHKQVKCVVEAVKYPLG
jgi:hypothetical protein